MIMSSATNKTEAVGISETNGQAFTCKAINIRIRIVRKLESKGNALVAASSQRNSLRFFTIPYKRNSLIFLLRIVLTSAKERRLGSSASSMRRSK